MIGWRTAVFGTAIAIGAASTILDDDKKNEEGAKENELIVKLEAESRAAKIERIVSLTVNNK